MTPSITLIDVLTDHLRQTATSFFPGVEEAPSVVLWTDPEKGWASLLPVLKQRLPELLVLGDYAPTERQGPAIWLKTAMAGKVSGLDLPKDRILILYLPGVARHELRQADQCPWELQPLVELLYRGTAWTHRNGKDWTVEGFFLSDEGLGLDLAKDEKTKLSLRSSLGVVALAPLSRLQGRRLEGSDFDAMVVGDTPRDLLTWIEHADAVKSEWGDERWHAFRSRCQDDYGFDPGSKAPLYAAELLGLREQSEWQLVWERYCEAPDVYGGVRDRLDQAQPTDRLALDAQAWPGENATREKRLAVAMEALGTLPPHAARQQISELEKEHGERRNWVWTKLGESPLACALKHIEVLAESTRSIPSFTSWSDFAQWYAEAGWQADRAALSAFREAGADEKPVREAIRSVYLPWLDEVCKKFQELQPAGGGIEDGILPSAGECIVFVDGMRLDLAHDLMEKLEQLNMSPVLNTRSAALPTVTATAKPAVSPIFGSLTGGAAVPPEFAPSISSGDLLTHARFLKALKEKGVVKVALEHPAPSTPEARGWLETGKIDSRGHDLEADLAKILPGEIDQVTGVLRRLLQAGWRKVTVVTDHGWLWMPGGLPKRDLPGFLVESRWSRCAAIKGQSVPDVPVVPWRWNPHASVAVAPGACCFKTGMEYAHGGVSPQECILPVIRIEGAEGSFDRPPARLQSVKWKRLRCTIEVVDATPGLKADIRREGTDKASSVVMKPKEVESDGLASLLVTDETLEGHTVTVVLLDTDGELIAKQTTTVGG
jgi:hypothetical protein